MFATFSVYHFVLFVYFMIKLEGTAHRSPSAGAPTSICFQGPGVRCLKEYIWRSELSTNK